MVAGDNRVEPRMGGNGAGKSTLWDALTFCLTGASVRGARGSDLITHGEKRCSVSAEFEIDGIPVTLSREGPPFHPRIDGEQAEQADVDRMFGLSRLRFLNSVVFGQAVPLFIDLPVPQRGELLDEVLDLQLWMCAAVHAGNRWATTQRELDKLLVEVARTEGALGALEDAAELRARVEEWDAAHVERKRALSDLVDTTGIELKALQKSLATIECARRPDAPGLLKAHQEAQEVESNLRSELAVVDREIERLDTDLRFFLENSECPTCGQGIAPELVENHGAKHRAELGEVRGRRVALDLEHGRAKAVTDAARVTWQKASADVQALARDLAVSRNQVQGKMSEVANLRRQHDQLAGEANPHAERLGKLRENRIALRTKLREQKRDERSTNTKLAQLDFWRQAFRRVRLFCMDRALKELDLETMNAAQSLGLVGWRILHATETETRSGTARMGVQVQVSSPNMSGPFVAWSGGEGQRVRLSSALGLAGMIQRWAGVRWNLEVFDEPTAWLSESGIEDLLDLLKNRADQLGKTVYIADHRGLQHAGFDRVMTIVKDERGSFVG